MRFVTVKNVAQQDLLALRRVRAQLVKSRTALCNQMHGLLRERGVVARVGAAGLKRDLPAALADESNELSGEMRGCFAMPIAETKRSPRSPKSTTGSPRALKPPI